MKIFSSIILIINGNPYVRPPDKILYKIFQQAGKNKGPIPVRGKLNGIEFQQSLLRYQDDWRLYINGAMAKKAGFKYSGSIIAIVGRKVKLFIEFDPKPPQYPMVPEFQTALNKDKKVRLAFKQLTPGRQKEILRYFSFMKNKESLIRNIERVMQHLRGEESDALYPLMHRRKTQ
jgi:hypothetical protein